MWRLAVGEVVRRWARSVGLIAGVAVAVAGFVLLAGQVRTQQLRVTRLASANDRSAYDILVRPQGSRLPLEVRRGLVRPNFLSGTFGGITLAQWRQIQRIPGVQVAAPIAMVGYVEVDLTAWIDVTKLVNPRLPHQLIVLKKTWVSDRGLSRQPDPGDTYIYITRNKVLFPGNSVNDSYAPQRVVYPDGTGQVAVNVSACGAGISSQVPDQLPAVEMLPDGKPMPLCWQTVLSQPDWNEQNVYSTALSQADIEVAERNTDGTFSYNTGYDQTSAVGPAQAWTSTRLLVPVNWPVTMLIAAVDPASEAKLVGLNKAVISGRYLKEGQVARKGLYQPDMAGIFVPLLATDAPGLDEQLSADVRVVTGEGPQIGNIPPAEVVARINAARSSPAGTSVVPVQVPYRQAAKVGARLNTHFNPDIQAGNPSYSLRGSTLVPHASAPASEQMWINTAFVGNFMPSFTQDVSFRPLSVLPGVSQSPEINGTVVPEPVVMGEITGVYDPSRLSGFSASPLSAVPLEEYEPASATGADAGSRRLLRNQPLIPNSDPGGYLAQPPDLLTTLSALPSLLPDNAPDAADPISAVRVRVNGVTGVDAMSQARVRTVAGLIAQRTGLAVDITTGSSPSPQRVQLAAGRYGRPELLVSEDWTVKGVAVTLVQAVDRKTLVLGVLIVLVCALFVANGASASVRMRRRELAVLACTGWPATHLARLVLAEAALTGVAGGVVGAAAAAAIGTLTGASLRPAVVLAAVPCAALLAMTASAWPAITAGRVQAAEWLSAHARPPRKAKPRCSVAALARSNVARVPGRTLAGAGALAAGVAAVTIVAAAELAFSRGAAGTLLGDAAALQVRGIDVAAAMTTVVLGAVALADVLYLGIRERDSELAALRAVGWTDQYLTRLVVTEGALTGIAGSVTGVAAGLAVTATAIGGITVPLLATAAGVLLAAIVMTLAASSIPALIVQRITPAPLLAAET